MRPGDPRTSEVTMPGIKPRSHWWAFITEPAQQLNLPTCNLQTKLHVLIIPLLSFRQDTGNFQPNPYTNRGDVFHDQPQSRQQMSTFKKQPQKFSRFPGTNRGGHVGKGYSTIGNAGDSSIRQHVMYSHGQKPQSNEIPSYSGRDAVKGGNAGNMSFKGCNTDNMSFRGGNYASGQWNVQTVNMSARGRGLKPKSGKTVVKIV